MKKNKYGLEPKVYARLYANWQNIKRRCNDPADKEYLNYGGRGISMCEEWQNSFQAYAEWAIAHGWEDGLTIERKDVNEGYNPNNCSFIPLREQFYNKTDTAWITFRGETKSLAKWCKELGLNQSTISTRRNRDGITDPNILFAPSKKRGRQVAQVDRNGNILETFETIVEASTITGTNRRSINNVLSGKAKTAGGSYWQYI